MSGFSLFSAPSIKVFFWFVPEAGGDPPQRPKRAPLPFLVLILARKRQSPPPFPPLLKEEGAKLLKAPFRVLRLLSSLGPSALPDPTPVHFTQKEEEEGPPLPSTLIKAKLGKGPQFSLGSPPPPSTSVRPGASLSSSSALGNFEFFQVGGRKGERGGIGERKESGGDFPSDLPSSFCLLLSAPLPFLFFGGSSSSSISPTFIYL